MKKSLALALGVLLGTACDSAKPDATPASAPEPAAKASEPAAVPTPGPGVGAPPALEPTGPSGGGRAGGMGSGAGRWKDTGVYLDGKPIAFLTFGELPITLKPTWRKVKVDAERRPGTQDPTWRWAEQRVYKWTDYLRALGVNPARIKEMHVYGPKAAEAIIVTGRDLTSRKAATFTFRFASELSGKALPQMPEDFGNNRTPDKITAVMIFVEKKPPTLIRNVGFELDGEPVKGVPYFGEPMRGGTRIYLDDKFVAAIKRNELDPATAKPGVAGQPSWNLYEFLASKGVDTSKVVEGWVIRRNRRAEKFATADLSKLGFLFKDGGSIDGAPMGGPMLLGDQQVVVDALALHTRTIADKELPVIRPEEEE